MSQSRKKNVLSFHVYSLLKQKTLKKKTYKKRKFLQVYNIYKKKINNNSRKLEIVRLSVSG